VSGKEASGKWKIASGPFDQPQRLVKAHLLLTSLPLASFPSAKNEKLANNTDYQQLTCQQNPINCQEFLFFRFWFLWYEIRLALHAIRNF